MKPEEIDGDVDDPNVMFTPRVDDVEACVIDYITQITLTEEWLEKFGFRMRNQYWNKSGMWFGKNNVFWWDTDTGGSIHIKHVHQLQNLYYALIGRELEIKDK